MKLKEALIQGNILEKATLLFKPEVDELAAKFAKRILSEVSEQVLKRSSEVKSKKNDFDFTIASLSFKNEESRKKFSDSMRADYVCILDRELINEISERYSAFFKINLSHDICKYMVVSLKKQLSNLFWDNEDCIFEMLDDTSHNYINCFCRISPAYNK